jgi:hypothetical protein
MPRDHDAAPAPMRAGSNIGLMGHPKRSEKVCQENASTVQSNGN